MAGFLAHVEDEIDASMRLRCPLQKILGQGALSLPCVSDLSLGREEAGTGLGATLPHASGVFLLTAVGQVAVMLTLSAPTSAVAGLGVGQRFPHSPCNGRATGCYPRSASTLGLTLQFFSQKRAGEGEPKGSLQKRSSRHPSPPPSPLP